MSEDKKDTHQIEQNSVKPVEQQMYIALGQIAEKGIQTVSVRMPNEDDLEDLESLLSHWIKNEETGEVISTEIQSVLKSIHDSITGKGDRSYVIASNESGNILGVMGIKRPEAEMLDYVTTQHPYEIVNAFVDPNSRGLGVGKKLKEAIEEKVASQGGTEIIVNSGPRYKDTGWEFWSSQFGEPIAVHENLYGPGLDAPVWRKVLE